MPLHTFSQGISFVGNEGLIENRTSFSVFENKTYRFNDSFSISFDLQIKKFDGFGYIFRLKDGEKYIYNLTYTYNNNETCSLRFNLEGEDNLLTVDLPVQLFRSGKWQRISLSFLLKEKVLIVDINGEEYRVSGLKLQPEMSPSIYFGKNEHIVDLPSFSLRNLQVGNNNQMLKFPLNESSGNEVHDQNRNIIGEVVNPIWLINDSYFWKHIFTYKSKNVSSICFNEPHQELIMFNRDSIVHLNLSTNTHRTEKQETPLPVDMRLGTSFLDTINNRIYVYEVNNLPVGNATIAYLDLASKKWHTLSTDYLPTQLHHHDGYLDYNNNRYLVFGGFGNQRYNKKIYNLDLGSGHWSTMSYSGDSILPRYFSGLAQYDKKLYIYGGMGNESGDQTIGKRYFYDLYQFDIGAKTSRKLWSKQWDRHNMISTRNMVMLNDTSFFTLCYPEHISNSYLQLYKFDVKDGAYTILGDSIPILSEKITTNANLYYCKRLNSFYCTVQIFQEDGSSVTEVYSISNPPIDKTGLTIYTSPQDKSWILGLITLPILCFAGWIIWRRSRKKKRKVLKPVDYNMEQSFGWEAIASERNPDQKNAIYLFGEFTVYDKKGKDITYMFSSRLEQTLFLIMENTTEEGISTQRLSEELWPDRAEYSVKNIRNVTINHLRKCLSELSGLEIIYEKGFYKLKIADDCYCDYLHYRQLIFEGKHPYNSIELKAIMSRGSFLKSNNNLLVNPFRKRESDRIKTILPIDIESLYRKEDYNATIVLCDLLFLNDELNETALLYKVNSLIKLEYTEDAKRIYAQYSVRHQQATEQKFQKSFSEIVLD